MKNRLFFLLAILLFWQVSMAQDSAYVIHGKLEKIKKGNIILNIYQGDQTARSSTTIKHGLFTFTGTISSPSFATLTMPDKPDDFFTFYVEPAEISIAGRGDSLKLLIVKGSGVNDDDRLLKERMNYISKWEEINSHIYEDAYKEKNKRVMDSLDEIDFDVLAEKRKVVAAFVKENPASMRAAMAITENYGFYAEAAEVEPLYDLLDPKIKESEKGKEIKKLLNIYRSVAIGNMAPEIKQSTPDGNLLSLSSLHGKYVLIDFWASWCGPCRRENPNVLQAYKNYKDKGFTVFGVSYDTKKDKWVKAIEDDKLNWNQVSDLEGWKNSTSGQYGIKAIPSNILLDKDGKIIAKNIFGKKLREKLSELLGQ